MILGPGYAKKGGPTTVTLVKEEEGLMISRARDEQRAGLMISRAGDEQRAGQGGVQLPHFLQGRQ